VRALILCGGRGVRSWPATAEVPKPMLRVGDRPVLHHVMAIYARHGITQFVLAAGYRHDVIAESLGALPSQWEVELIDTGDDTDTGDRVRRCLDRLDDRFLATYGDGLGNVDVTQLTKRHDSHGRGATVTAVPLPSQFGTLVVDDRDRVTSFREKPLLADHIINAGFFVFDRDAFSRCTGSSLEQDILPALAGSGELFVYRHDGFWKSMDTYKDVIELNQLAQGKEPPWLPS
jgi:glucose-1-phosphate cytidylyltransferase